MGDGIVIVLDFAARHDDECPFELDDEEINGDRDGALQRAARAYHRECGGDFAPDPAGVWLLYVIPTEGWGGDDACSTTATWSGS